ncbi:LAME_0F09626g1_1 [Lachancea meyersii CBS 8951]|uniref:LAME_0F09626g1_1 n=1 Tax=Lachancea meyersii CBS 8951 TaxID=1266667 RepID=A0A1G4JV18_9SACH|nr:LAME_0F09626g1_1 [Lachancea meyersii CBS 8951]
MEKFTNWRDKGTGIAPFLPTPPPLSQEKGLGLVLNNVKFVFKAVCVFPLALLALMMPEMVSKKLWLIVMKVLFSWSIQVAAQGVKKRDQRGELPATGHVYVVNCNCPLDALVLWFLAQGPVAFCVPLIRGKSTRVFQLSVWQFFEFALNSGQIHGDLSSFREVETVSQLKNQVVYVFAEGTTSNGKSVLPFAFSQESWLDLLDQRSATAGSSSSYNSSTRLSTPKVDINAIQLKVNSSLTTPLRIDRWKYLVRASSQGVSYKCKMIKSVEPQLEKVRTALVGGDKFRLVGKELNFESKLRFVKEFASRRR